ncbi:MAG TPA: hypothetical protein PLK35_00090 [Candidatus Moranbacteria bacterium]|nr:hypothetical protein [Candidatus Moranbacteria bacterium]
MFKKINLKLKTIPLKIYVDTIFVAMAVFIGAYFKWNVVEIMIFGVFIGTLLRPVPSHYPAVVALFFLALTPVFLAFGNNLVPEKLAIYAYFFIIISVIMGIYEIRNEKSPS